LEALKANKQNEISDTDVHTVQNLSENVAEKSCARIQKEGGHFKQLR
jgi:hypothetical protein